MATYAINLAGALSRSMPDNGREQACTNKAPLLTRLEGSDRACTCVGLQGQVPADLVRRQASTELAKRRASGTLDGMLRANSQASPASSGTLPQCAA